MTRVIFLDIDGVLVTARSHHAHLHKGGLMVDYDKCIAEFLCNFCNKYDYRIVISSTWRHNIPRLFTLLNQSGLINWLYDPININNSMAPKLNFEEQCISRENRLLNTSEGFINYNWGRGLEIAKWLEVETERLNKLYPQVYNFTVIILDDDMDVNYFMDKPHYLVINPESSNGLSADDMRKMIYWKEGSDEK